MRLRCGNLNGVIFLIVVMQPMVSCMKNGAGRVPPLGWSSWKTCADENCTHDFCDEKEIKNVAIAMQQNGMQEI